MKKTSQITYDSFAEMGYFYLLSPLADDILSTEELDHNDEIMLDIGRQVPIIGIEFEGETAKKIAPFSGKNKIFKEIVLNSGETIFSFRLSDLPSKQSVKHKNIDSVVFHFADNNYQEFLGIDIIDTKLYLKEYLIQQNNDNTDI
ncbi:DUF2283 domain-containing protein [Bacillus badius]|uniref:DUF2283 domain-containing protein n=1 Tax=Bacillus badius TaxID=1455 RepID=UPI0005974687|nr:DUF2283 domain-containing protein [Bacillus badius]KIL74842.1 hypothetical protein SD78_1911 [Bacillus badius]